MPTRKAATPPDDDDDINPASPPPPDEQDSPPSLADRIRAMSTHEDIDRVKVKVYRRIPGRTTLEWCADYSVPDYEQGELAMLRDDWGPGDYQIRVYSAGRGIMLRDDIRVAASLRRNNPEPTPAPAPAQTSELAEVVRMLAEGQSRILEALQSRPDPTAQLQQTLGLMSTMREAMGLNNPPPPPPPASDPGAMLGQLVGAIRTLREVSQEVAPPAPDTDNPLSMLPQVLDLVKTGMGQQQHPPMLGHEPVQPLQVPGTFANADDHEGDDDMRMPNLGMLALRGQLAKLVKMAQAGEDPKAGGLFVAEHLPDELIPALRSEAWFEMMQPFYAGIVHFKPWLTEARAEAIRLLDAQSGAKL